MAVVYNPSQKRLQQAYAEAIKDITDYLVQQLSIDGVPVTEVIDQMSILRQLEAMLRDLDVEVYTEVSELLAEKFNSARLKYYVDIGDVKTLAEAAAIAPFTMMNQQKLEAIVADTMADVLKATQNTETALKLIVRDTVEKRLQMGSLTGKGSQQIAKELFNELSAKGLSAKIAEDGFVGIVDAAGKKWDLKTYVDTVVKTKLMTAHTEAARVEGLRTGVDLAVISQHGSTDDCAKWENVIISMNGMTEGFPTYAEVKATNECFHPNCQHGLRAFRNLDLISDRTKGISEKKMQDNWETLNKTE